MIRFSPKRGGAIFCVPSASVFAVNQLFGLMCHFPIRAREHMSSLDAVFRLCIRYDLDPREIDKGNGRRSTMQWR